ncbi:hypothetical protein AVEN_171447-1 [Araneus ventricosus]|uniref:RNase H type-1 domain-containing protein n=1 Tax=Araneus ventricosus TaxID=182803 RepID=A0A4Y2D3T5_ARAVE|nr:hypothetical protein AVEN_171447-1 [Araneus ventricosus]
MPNKRKSIPASSSRVARAMKVTRKLESDVQAEATKSDQAERQSAFRSAETQEQSQVRRTKDIERHASVRAAESPDESQRRRDVNTKQQSEQRCAFQHNMWTAFNDAEFDYYPLIDYANQRLVMIGKIDGKCVHCKAFKWKEEAAGMCCSGGKVSLPLLSFTWSRSATVNKVKKNYYLSEGSVGLTWVKAHAGDPGNELADHHAKLATAEGEKLEIATPYSSVKFIIEKNLLSDWQETWDDYDSESGRRTRDFVPKGDSKKGGQTLRLGQAYDKHPESHRNMGAQTSSAAADGI